MMCNLSHKHIRKSVSNFNSTGRTIDSLRYSYEYRESVFGNLTRTHLIRFDLAGAGALAPVADSVYRVEGETQLATFFHTMTEYEDYYYSSPQARLVMRHTCSTQGIVYTAPAYVELQFHR